MNMKYIMETSFTRQLSSDIWQWDIKSALQQSSRSWDTIWSLRARSSFGVLSVA